MIIARLITMAAALIPLPMSGLILLTVPLLSVSLPLSLPLRLAHEAIDHPTETALLLLLMVLLRLATTHKAIQDPA